MIDFRYHLVSLVSVFLALAVGIVLGAGPLKESLGDSLNKQVQALRTDRDGLRDDLTRAQGSVDHRDDFITAVTPGLIADQLGGRAVALVVVPGADRDTVDDVEAALARAGATVTGRIALTDAWVDPGRDAERTSLAAQLKSRLGPTVPGPTPSLAQVLASVLVTPEIAQAGPLSEAASAALGTLREEKYLGSDGLPSSRATAAVVVAPPVPTGVSGEDLQTRQDAAKRWRDLSAVLDAGSDGVVVEGPASAAGPGGVVEAVRDGDARRIVSTVDTGGTSMGPVAAVLALAEQLRGQDGHYGFADRATSPLPAQATAATS